MRWLTLVLLAACADPSEGFHFQLRFDSTTASVDVDGRANPTQLDYWFDSYEEARIRLQVQVTATLGGESVDTLVSPGICANQPLPVGTSFGTLKLETIDYRVEAPPLLLEVYAFECDGSDFSLISAP